MYIGNSTGNVTETDSGLNGSPAADLFRSWSYIVFNQNRKEKHMKKKLVSVLLTASMAATVLAGCGGASAPAAAPAAQEEAKEEAPAEEKEEAAAPASAAGAAASAAEAGAGKVYYLNFKPEADPQWQELAKAYTEETGVPVTVVTAASGEYETTLQAEMAKSDAPTLFQVNGPVGLKNWADYCYDLTGSDIVNNLTSDAFELKNEDGSIEVSDMLSSLTASSPTRPFWRRPATQLTISRALTI